MHQISFKKVKKNNESGQALLFVIITMTIALALGIGLSLETITSVSNVADTDTSQRALAAAEGAAERTLTLDNTSLSTLQTNMNATNCQNILKGQWENGKCYVQFTSSGGTGQDPVEVRASVEVSTYDVTNPNNYSSVMQIAENDLKEVFLEGYAHNNIQVCWNGSADLYYKVYNASGDTVNGIIRCSSANCNSGWNYGTTAVASTGSSLSPSRPYNSCYNIRVQGPGGVNNPKGLRLRTLGAAIDEGALYPTPTLPVQGFKIETHGELVNFDGIQRDVTVFKSFSYLPAVFDFSFYSKNNLSL